MIETYTTVTKDTNEYKSTICGRTDDISSLIQHIVRRQSVAMFGERRIGKTSVLFLIRDIINGSINDYQTKLIDSDLREAVASLQAKTPSYKSCYINLQALSQYDFDTFMQQLYKKGLEVGLLSIKQSLNPKDIEIFSELDRASEGGCFVVLYKSCFINLQSFREYTLEAFMQKLHTAGLEVGLLPPINPGQPLLNYKELDIFRMLDAACILGRFVVLIDEIEVLKNFSSDDQIKIVRNLRDATTYAHLCFIIAGAENWYSDIKDGSSALSGVLKLHTLSAPTPSPTVNHLIRQPLERLLLPYRVNKIDKVVTTVQRWTGCKPFYVQSVCDSIVKISQRHNRLPRDWQTRVLKDVYDNTAPEVLNHFYTEDNLDNLTRDILALLAHRPNLTVKKIAWLLGYNKRINQVEKSLKVLTDFDKIRQQGGKYRIVGTLIENWGYKYQLRPTLHDPLAKHKSIAFHLLVAISTVFIVIVALIYANPPNTPIQRKFADGTVSLEVPSSLEEDQKGTIIVYIQNNSSHTISSIQVLLKSGDIYYSGHLTFPPIQAGDELPMSVTFAVRSSVSNSVLTSNVIITEDGKPSSPIQSFSITKRWFPIRKYQTLGGLLLAALAIILSIGKAILDITNSIIGKQDKAPSSASS